MLESLVLMIGKLKEIHTMLLLPLFLLLFVIPVSSHNGAVPSLG